MIAFSCYTSTKLLFFSLCHLLFFISLSLKPSSASSLPGLYEDSQQLLNFRASLPKPNPLRDWVPGGHPCNFTGVTCKNSRVSAIDLNYVQLNVNFSIVSKFLITLPNLESLLLKRSNLTGSLSSMAKNQCGAVLDTVDLAENGLSGPLSELSSFAAAACSSLSSLNLSNNLFDFTLRGAKDDYSNGLRFNFRVLDLSYNNISGHNVVPWLLSGGCGKLRHLSLKGNKISGNVPVSDCESLEHLDLSSNNFTNGFPSFGDCSSLQHLDLSSNKFSGAVGTSLSSCKSLSFLNLTNNKFAGGLPALPGGSMQFLYLSDNDFHGEIPADVGGSLCSNLVELDLSLNNLSGTLPKSLTSCSVLESLDISHNNFSGELPIDTLLQMGSLKNISLAFNNFAGALPDSFSKLTTLESLDVSSNSLNGFIPRRICENPSNSLKVLSLQNNGFTGPIPETLSNRSQLVSLDLSFNYLNGTIPPSLGSLSKLRDLMIWLNQLHGEIPHELTYIETLENLILDFNDLSGRIPASLSNCSNLNWISLSNNKLTGEIPASLGRLANLAILKLGNNSITGSIPAELGDCRSLIWLDLNTNMLNGTIPPALFKQSRSIAVGLLTGKSYIYIKNDGSKQCHGAGNLLEFGGIRQEQLNRISTRHPCNFTRVYKGITQPIFNHNGSKILLDLSFNLLEGSVPKELGSMYYLSVLNLGHNDLSGSIPEELGGLKMLAILDLSYNRLSGSIPQSLTSLALLGEFDLSNNNLSGHIPQSSPLTRFPIIHSRIIPGSVCTLFLVVVGADSSSSSNSQHQMSNRKQASLVGSVAMGLLFSLFCIFGLIIVAIEAKKRRKKKEAALEAYMDGHSHSGTANSIGKPTGAREAIELHLLTSQT